MLSGPMLALGRAQGAGPLPVVTKIRRLGYRLAFLVLQVWWFVRRPHTAGVKVLIRRGDEALFVRHTYGNRAAWELPGGGLRTGETTHEAARREVREELGLGIDNWAEIGVVTARKYATATLTCLTAADTGEPLTLALHEIVEARWAPITAPPEPLGEHARAALNLLDPAVR